MSKTTPSFRPISVNYIPRKYRPIPNRNTNLEFGPEKWARFCTQNSRQQWWTVHRPHHLWTAKIQSGHRAATQSTSSADSADSFGGNAAVVGGSGAEQRSLCCRGTMFLHCKRWDNRNTPSINRMSVLEAPLSLICIRYHWESATPKRRGGEVVKL